MLERSSGDESGLVLDGGRWNWSFPLSSSAGLLSTDHRAGEFDGTQNTGTSFVTARCTISAVPPRPRDGRPFHTATSTSLRIETYFPTAT